MLILLKNEKDPDTYLRLLCGTGTVFCNIGNNPYQVWKEATSLDEFPPDSSIEKTSAIINEIISIRALLGI